jgi:3-phosphoglycerate kinase
LGKLLGKKISFVSDCVGSSSEKSTEGLKAGDVVMLENLRFHSEEEENDPNFSKKLSKHGDLFVQDAFGALHRAHASTAGVPKYLDGGVGLLVQKEIEFLDRVMGNPQRPFLAILGGAKVSDKLGVMNKLVERVDKLVIGGAMAYTFLVAQNVSVGKSKVEKDRLEDAQRIVEKAYGRNVECLLPADHMVVPELKPDAHLEETQGMAIPPEMIGVDIGSHAIELFSDAIEEAKTIFWNGPMGIFEMPRFAKGSNAIAKAMARATGNGATTIVGGGDSLAVLEKLKLQDKMTHCSTGGGASLEFLEGKVLPGILALSHK